jgi:hypothetical protein
MTAAAALRILMVEDVEAELNARELELSGFDVEWRRVEADRHRAVTREGGLVPGMELPEKPFAGEARARALRGALARGLA